MDIMLHDVIACDGNMACLARRFGGAFIAMVWSRVFGASCMPVQRISAVAINAGHSILAEMNIGSQVFMFAKKLSAYAASVAGCTGAGHGWIFSKIVPIQQPSTNTSGLADVTITTAGMAASAVIAEHFVHRWFFAVRPSRFKHSPVAFLCRVKARVSRFGLIIVTIAANFRRSGAWS
jgi:hypothetical protein